LEKVSAKEQNAISGKYLCDPNSVILSKIRPRLRKAVLVDFKCLCSADMYPLMCDERILPRFLKYLILEERFCTFSATVSERSNIPKINRIEIAEFRFALPPIEEQRFIGDALNAIDFRIEIVQGKLTHLKSLKSALMQDLLTGKVRVTVN
jgi:type I restriction enzyme S subunit